MYFYVELPIEGNFKATLFDVSGRLISVLRDVQVPAGFHFVWVEDLRPGLYFVRVESGFWSDVVSFTVIE